MCSDLKVHVMIIAGILNIILNQAHYPPICGALALPPALPPEVGGVAERASIIGMGS